MHKAEQWGDQDDSVYYNITIRNPTIVEEDAKINDTRVQNVLDNPSMYELAVVRFSIPAYSIPIMFFRKNLQILFSYEGALAESTVQFIPNEESPIYGRDTIWNYSEMIDAINISLKEAYDDIKVQRPLVPNTEAPFFRYDIQTRRISLYAEDTYSNIADTITITINESLRRLMPTFRFYRSQIFPPFRTYDFVITQDLFNTTTIGGKPYLIMEEEEETRYLWSELQALLFETNTIPVNPEFLSSQNNQIRRVITDFEPNKGDPSKQSIQFFPQGPLRYYDLVSNYALRTIDLSIFWQDRDGKTYPVKVQNGDVLTCKLKFRKKLARHLKEVFDEDGIER